MQACRNAELVEQIRHAAHDGEGAAKADQVHDTRRGHAARDSIETVALVRAAFIIMIQFIFCVLIRKKVKVLPYPFAVNRS